MVVRAARLGKRGPAPNTAESQGQRVTDDRSAVEEKVDSTFGMRRVEVLCAAAAATWAMCPTGLRYCLNGVALNFTPA